MGRQIKEGLSYFPIDVDFFEDEKVSFVSARFGVKGDGIVIRILCKIYRQGYCIKFNDDVALLFARSVGDINLHGLVKDVVNELLKREFFDENIFKSFGILTSKGIQKRYIKICTDARRKNYEIPKEYDLLMSLPSFTHEEIKKTHEESKQRKEKKRKEEESKEIIAPQVFKDESIDLKFWVTEKQSFLNSEGWQYQLCTEKTITQAALKIKLAEFITDIELKEDYKDQRGLKKHFINWLNKQKNGNFTTSTSSTSARQQSNDASATFLKNAIAEVESIARGIQHDRT